MILRVQSSLQAGLPWVSLWWCAPVPGISPSFCWCGNDELMLAEMRSGFRCPIPRLDGMRMRGELILVITEPVDRPWGASEGV